MLEHGTGAFVAKDREKTDGIERHGRGKEGNATCPASENIGGIRKSDEQSDGNPRDRNTTVLSPPPILEALISSKSDQGATLSNRAGPSTAEAGKINTGNKNAGVIVTSASLEESYTPPTASYNNPFEVQSPSSPTRGAHVPVGEHGNIDVVPGGNGSPGGARSTENIDEPTVGEGSEMHTNTVGDVNPIRGCPRLVNVVSARKKSEGMEGEQAGESGGASAFSYSGDGGREAATHAGGRGKHITNQPQQQHQRSAGGEDTARDGHTFEGISQKIILRDEKGTDEKHRISNSSPGSRSCTSPSVDPQRLGLEVEQFGNVQDFDVEDISEIEVGGGWESDGGDNWIEGSSRASMSS